MVKLVDERVERFCALGVFLVEQSHSAILLFVWLRPNPRRVFVLSRFWENGDVSWDQDFMVTGHSSARSTMRKNVISSRSRMGVQTRNLKFWSLS